MPATIIIAAYHGAAPGSPTGDLDGTTVRYKVADDDAQDSNDPIPIPGSGFEYSWRKSFKILATVGPDNEIRNLRLFSEQQDLGTHRTLLIDQQAAYTQGAVGDESSPISAVDVDTYTSGVPLAVNAGQVFSAAETGDGTQDFVELQAKVGPAATAGNVDNALGCVWRYDEL